MQVITVQFIPTKADYVRSVRAYYARQRIVWLTYAILAALCVLALAAGVFLDADYLGLATTLGVVTLISLAFLLLVMPFMAHLQMRWNERSLCETIWQITGDRISITNTFGEATFDWGTFRRVFETRDYYLFSYTANRNLFQILPKRAFVSAEQATAFRKLVERKLPGLSPAPPE